MSHFELKCVCVFGAEMRDTLVTVIRFPCLYNSHWNCGEKQFIRVRVCVLLFLFVYICVACRHSVCLCVSAIVSASVGVWVGRR